MRLKVVLTQFRLCQKLSTDAVACIAASRPLRWALNIAVEAEIGLLPARRYVEH
jgi:hypothetical protein